MANNIIKNYLQRKINFYEYQNIFQRKFVLFEIISNFASSLINEY